MPSFLRSSRVVQIPRKLNSAALTKYISIWFLARASRSRSAIWSKANQALCLIFGVQGGNLTKSRTQLSLASARSFSFCCRNSPSPPGFWNSSTIFLVLSNCSWEQMGLIPSRYSCRVVLSSGTGSFGSGSCKRRMSDVNHRFRHTWLTLSCMSTDQV